MQLSRDLCYGCVTVVVMYLWNVVASLLTHSVEPGQTEERLSACQLTTFTDLLGAPRFIRPLQILLEAWRRLNKHTHIHVLSVREFICGGASLHLN